MACLAAVAFGLWRGRTSLVAVALLCGGAIAGSTHQPSVTVSVRRARPEVDGNRLASLRGAAARRIDSSFGPAAPMARALLIADQHQIPLEMRDRFARSGLIHLLSISGLHVAIIGESLVLLFQVLRLGPRVAVVAQLASIAAYVLVIGAPAPAVRSAVMVGMQSAARLFQRPTSPWALLALGALLPLVRPGTAGDLGYQLSVMGMAALIASRSLTRRVFPGRTSGWRLTLGRDLIASVVATIATAPLIAWTFGRISLIGPVANLVAAPIIGLLQPMLFLALVLSPIPGLGHFVAGGAGLLLAAFDRTAALFAGLPHSSVELAPSIAASLGVGIAVVAALVAAASRFPGTPLVVAAGALAAVSAVPLVPAPGSGMLEMHVLDVGQGDAVLFRTPKGRWIVFDAGPAWRGGDAGRSAVIPYIRSRGGDVWGFILSHPHLDHVGGASSVLRNLRPLQYRDAAFAGGARAYRESLREAVRTGVNWQRIRPGSTEVVDGVTLRFLAPDSVWTSALGDANEASSVVRVEFGSSRFLLMGDAERREEQWLLANAAEMLSADVLKVGHHGSSTSTERDFLAAVCPGLAAISVGSRNMYGHPSADVLATLGRAGAQVLRTDQDGTIIVRTDGHSIHARARGAEWESIQRFVTVSSGGKSNCRPRFRSDTPNSAQSIFGGVAFRRESRDGRLDAAR